MMPSNEEILAAGRFELAQGRSYDGVVILLNGKPINVCQIVDYLNQRVPVEVESISAERLREQLRPYADSNCRDCDGCGVYYGNVCVCGCVMNRIVESACQSNEAALMSALKGLPRWSVDGKSKTIDGKDMTGKHVVFADELDKVITTLPSLLAERTRPAGEAVPDVASDETLRNIMQRFVASLPPDDPRLDIAEAIARYLRVPKEEYPAAYETAQPSVPLGSVPVQRELLTSCVQMLFSASNGKENVWASHARELQQAIAEHAANRNANG